MPKYLSQINKIKDFFKFDKHRTIRSEIVNLIKQIKDKTYDYGEGYFYQSLEKINLSGLRSSEKRISQYDIANEINGSEILDVGSNYGFILFQLENVYKSATGIEYNQKLVRVALKIKSYLKRENIFFIQADFLDHNFENNNFNFIFSLANHSTFDKGIVSTDIFFEKCNRLLRSGGHFLVEGHHPKYEKIETFDSLISNFINRYGYEIKNEKFLKTGNLYDDGRKFFLLRKK
jgi:ubiquinone/menaquinone biosynthesis C-methylase UbiE|tara:strand:+ start:720 stop:1418 length:699 start_codon:yes stop_codon:yes gene_type:complete